MLLTGTFKRSIDDKLRLAIPKRFRDVIATASETESGATVLFVAPGTDGSLTLYTEGSFTRLADQLDQLPPTGKDVRAFSRLFFSRAERLELDKQGRIRIPTELAQMGEIGAEAMLIGVRDRMEIWNLDRWESYKQQTERNYDSLAEQALSSQRSNS